ncbi:MAG: M23 family metallopeptidase [Clostridia bacterium]|nr:M23 family metallopeptidase [Clostridia bacterium]
MKHTLLWLCALLLVCSACAPSPAAPSALSHPAQLAAPPSPTPLPTPLPTPGAVELADAFCALWEAALHIDVSPFLPATFFDAAAPWQIFGTPQEERVWLPAMQSAVAEQLASAAARATLAFEGAHKDLTVDVEQSITEPSWQLLYALMQGCENAEAANARIKEAIALDVQAALLQSALSLRLTAAPLAYREALRLGGGEESALLSRCFTYSYLYTVFGADAAEVEYEQPPAEGCLLDGFVWPLASHTRLRKTWYADRDDGRRKHTGTDIWAKADTEIYACTNGTVTYVGEGKGTGFAVIVTDAYGYEYHYYHMIRLSDFLHAGDAVTAGMLIGRVGNTGNSDLDHLHLTIVAPDGKYVNPYPYLKAMEP